MTRVERRARRRWIRHVLRDQRTGPIKRLALGTWVAVIKRNGSSYVGKVTRNGLRPIGPLT